MGGIAHCVNFIDRQHRIHDSPRQLVVPPIGICNNLTLQGFEANIGESMANESPIREMRVAITVPNYEDAIRFYRDVLGLPVVESWDNPTGQGSVLDAGRATLEIIST